MFSISFLFSSLRTDIVAYRGVMVDLESAIVLFIYGDGGETFRKTLLTSLMIV